MLKKPVGLKGFATYLPPIKLDQAAIVKRAQGSLTSAQALGVKNKRLATESDDTLTLGVEATLKLKQTTDLSDIGALYLGSETPVYSVGNTAASIANFVGINGEDLKTADLEFACRAGTLAMISAIGHVQSFDSDALAVAADVASGKLGDVLAMTTGAGAAAFYLTQTLENCPAQINQIYSFTQRRSDFWRAPNSPHPQHAGRYSNQMYTETLTKAITGFLTHTKTQISDFDHVILHQPNGKLPYSLAKNLGISAEQMAVGFCFGETGNLYAAMVPFSLVQVLKVATPGQRILVASYGSGAGSDVLEVETNAALTDYQKQLADQNPDLVYDDTKN